MTLSLRYLQDISAFHDAVLPQACRKMGTELIEVNWNNPNAIELLKDKLSGLNLSNRSL